jgi:hypothetical protein
MIELKVLKWKSHKGLPLLSKICITIGNGSNDLVASAQIKEVEIQKRAGRTCSEKKLKYLAWKRYSRQEYADYTEHQRERAKYAEGIQQKSDDRVAHDRALLARLASLDMFDKNITNTLILRAVNSRLRVMEEIDYMCALNNPHRRDLSTYDPSAWCKSLVEYDMYCQFTHQVSRHHYAMDYNLLRSAYEKCELRSAYEKCELRSAYEKCELRLPCIQTILTYAERYPPEPSGVVKININSLLLSTPTNCVVIFEFLTKTNIAIDWNLTVDSFHMMARWNFYSIIDIIESGVGKVLNYKNSYEWRYLNDIKMQIERGTIANNGIYDETRQSFTDSFMYNADIIICPIRRMLVRDLWKKN